MRFSHRQLLLLALALGVSTLGAWLANPLAGQSTPAVEATEQKPAPPNPAKLTTAQLDALISAESHGPTAPDAAADQQFVRRASFDLVGRQPTLDEQRQFAQDSSPNKHHDLVERLLASHEFGANWANYWSDTIAFRVPPPELTYLDYAPLQNWLAGKFNGNTPWNEVARELITAKGKIADQPPATFVGYHQAKATNLAAETSRIFLGQQIGCAECHDHPFDHWKRRQFHELAAFFARTKAKLPWNDGAATVVSAADKGEYLMPDMADPRQKGSEIAPAFLDGKQCESASDDGQRRAQLAEWLTARDNPWFARAYVNRVWARLMGHGFHEPVDDLGVSRAQLWPAVHEALAGHFVASNFDVKDLFRLVMNSEAYRRGARMESVVVAGAIVAEAPPRLRGDEVFAALRVGLDLANVTPPAVKPTDAIRFPPPPKSTREIVKEAFAVDPSLASADAPRTMAQALWMMNNLQLQKEINAAPGSGTMLAKLLAEQADDRAACETLFARVLARAPTADELRISLAHVAALGNRGAAFEDLLWSLINSAEFTTRR
jgi:hypothetical protein